MKKLTAIFIAAVLCFSLVGCAQKSQDVKNTEVMIKAIGTVTQDSGEDIATAEKFYNGLTEEEKGQVSNYNTLVQARAEYNEMIMYGQWSKFVTDKDSTLTLNRDGSFSMSDGTSGTYENTDSAVVLSADGGHTITLKKDVHMNLVHLVADDGTDYIRPDLLTVDKDKIVLGGWHRFFDITYHVHTVKDSLGLAEDWWNSILIRPKAEYIPYMTDVNVTLTMKYTTRDVVTVHNILDDSLIIKEELTQPVEQTVTMQLTADSFANMDKCCDAGFELAKGETSQYENYKHLLKALSYLENADVQAFEGEIWYYNQLKDYYTDK